MHTHNIKAQYKIETVFFHKSAFKQHIHFTKYSNVIPRKIRGLLKF